MPFAPSIAFLLAASSALLAEGTPLDREALLADPALRDLKIVYVQRAITPGNDGHLMRRLGIPSNHESHSSMDRMGYENEIVLLDIATGETTTLYKPPHNGYVGDLDLHWDGARLLFTQSDEQGWKLWEIDIDGQSLRQVSQTPDDVDCFDACYLPDGRIVTASNAPWQCIPCWHGVAQKFVANLYIMNADGTGMRRLCFDQDHDMHPSVRNDGQVVFSRWDYTGINRLFLRPLMVMNPDGTGQRALYGSNSWFPNGLYSPHELPGANGKFLCILAGYHGSNRNGHLVIVNTNLGTKEDEGIVQRISGRGLPLEVRYMDRLTEHEYPKFSTPAPITSTHFLVSAQMEDEPDSIGLYLADTSDTLRLIRKTKGYALLEPIPVIRRPMPPGIPDRIDRERDDATIFLQDVYCGQGLDGVPRGVVKRLRVIAYDFGYVGLAGTDKIGLSGPWEAMRIIGTTPVGEDGSASFRVPANTPLAFQALDAEGKAVQLMRTWFTAMPGESVGCVGCHESVQHAPPMGSPSAAYRPPEDLEPWCGPPRGFDFAREVQPVLNRYCVQCHDGETQTLDLRPEEQVEDYVGVVPGYYDRTRMHPTHKARYGGSVKYTPAYEALLPYIRRVNIGDDVSVLRPGHYHADTSELVQLLQNAHYGVSLDEESWSRIVTWIDLNGPCHGTWQDVFDMPVPDGGHERRLELAAAYGGPPDDPETTPNSSSYDETPVTPQKTVSEPQEVQARRTERLAGSKPMTLPLGDGQAIELRRVDSSYWMSACEITNEQFALFDTSHESGYYTKRHAERADDKGIPLNGPKQPVLRVCFNQALAFCDWLSKKTGKNVSLPTETQWEFACRGGNSSAFHFGGTDDDFSPWANMADKTFASFGARGRDGQHFLVAGDVDFIDAEGVALADRRYDDKGCVTMPVGSYAPNAFGLYDMHGNAAEWTLTEESGERVVKGGSYLDRPSRCRVSNRYCFPPWQKVYNTGFRIVINE